MTSETGVFWLPDDPDTKLPGHLGIAGDGTPTLDLHGALTPSMELVNHNEETGVFEMAPADDPPSLVIHGFLENYPRSVTLVDCLTTRRSEVHFTRVPLDQHKLARIFRPPADDRRDATRWAAVVDSGVGV